MTRQSSPLVPPRRGIAFERGSLSFAGHGDHTRTGNLFFVMPDASDAQLEAFGHEPWDTPFGRVEPASYAATAKLLKTTSDTAPWGDGPDPDKLHKWGYEYIERRPFKDKLSYFNNCAIRETSEPPAQNTKRKFPGHNTLKKAGSLLKGAFGKKQKDEL